jgi:geranylgeranyl pyrophosphate synthase
MDKYAALFDLLHARLQELVSEIREGDCLREVLAWLVESDWQTKKAKWPVAILPLLTCCLSGGNLEAGSGVTASWSLLHLAAGLFDDVEDGDDVFGPGGPMPPAEAVNAATTCLCLAYLALDSLAETLPPATVQRLRLELGRMLIQTCAGQHQDLARMMSDQANLDRYWQVAALKTGRSFGWGCWAGAVAGGANAVESAQCQTYGYNLGILLQISDDWAGFLSAAEPNDLMRGKRTLPILYALTILPPGQRQRLEVLLAEAQRSRVAADAARSEIIRLGGLHYTLVQARIYYKRAETAIPFASDGQAQEALFFLLKNVFPLRI